jgi:DNA-binding CsgD family transcriptional regulator
VPARDAPSLFGRASERAALERWLGAVAGGAAGCALLEGEAGIGKTRLAQVLAAEARRLGFAVCAGGADELDRGRPFAALDEALGFTPEAPADAAAVPGLEFRLVDQLVEAVEVRALERPVAVVIEDLQWADPGTIVALRAIGRRLAHLPVALLATFRPWPRSAELDLLVEAWRAGGAVHVVLEPLDAAAVGAFVAELAGAAPGPGLRRQLASTAGNPLFVRELVGSLLEEGTIELVDGQAEVGAQSLPPSLRLTILRRAALLGEAALSLLRSASLLGSTFALADLATVSGMPVTAVVDELMQARRAGIVEEAGDLMRFRHDLIREALYTDLPESARRALHRDAGRRLAQAGAPKLQVAEQLELGASPGDEQAVRWLWDAAREWVLRAPQAAVDLLERAVALTPAPRPERDALLADLADGLVWCGRPAEGQALAAELLGRGVPPATRAQARSTVVRGLWMESRWREIVAHVDRWLAAPDPALDAPARARLLADAAMAAVFSGEVLRAEGMALEALRAGEELADDAIVFAALFALGPIHNFRGRKEEELAVSERALAIAERGANPDVVRFHPHFAVAMSLGGLDRHAGAEAMFSAGLRAREELGTVWDLPLYQAGLADLHCRMGKWDEALADAETGVATAEEVGTRIGVVVCAGVGALIRAHRDELAQAGGLLATVRSEIDRAGPQWGSYWTALAAAQLAEAKGEHDAALGALRAEWEASAQSTGVRVYLAPELVRLALAAEERELARAVAEDAAAAVAAAPGVASATGSALLCGGRLHGDPAVLARAVDSFRASGWRPELAGALESAASALAERGDAAAARPLFEEALAVYAALDARRDSARALAAMRAHGLRRGSRAAHRRALKGWDSLTVMEAEVVRLTVEGLTNREIGERLFISRRTVQTHLAHVFAKLDVSTRVELAAAAARAAGTFAPPSRRTGEETR